ncbi:MULTISPECIES: PqqD family peptide modification chaperone [Bacillus]|jgi:hypothetical protein|uniref:PqqD family protein n=1 Tax=Bacillus cereus TaxID=1396 RepID=A0A2C1LYS4_BACCE|nr:MULTISPECIES: hypothetical protein [Bacillus]MDH4424706.1 hypothetical protein [Bacillus cereus]PGL82361.1 hypothetical protein CN931_14930 [Bacillus sp. AFS054943]PGU02801.1 hypothetical protein COD19_10705 [Bacillus cereus]PGX16222.1 hypothetical protein COE07_01805 [Bacillus sp. AFS033286]PGZ68483.1 hypothetical protein COE49_25340 [Bacillus sp. AFS029637]
MIIRQNDMVSSTIHDEEVVLLDMSKEIYYGLEGATMLLWNELSDGPVDTIKILEKWKSKYDHSEEEVEHIFSQSLHELTSRDLVVIDT